MVTRVTADEVKALMAPYADDADTAISLCIDQANMLVNEDLAAKGLSEDRLRFIELNLAAHFTTVAVERGGFTYQRAGNAQEGYATDSTQVKFSSTRFGQQALALDTTATLATLDTKGGYAEFKVVSVKDSGCALYTA